MSYKIRPFDKGLDSKAVHRIWREIAWVENDEQERAMDVFLEGGRATVADLNGSAECLVVAEDGVLKYLDQDLDISIIASVTTSRIARKQGLASKMTAQLIADEAQRGAKLSTLGIFEQGFYNQFGYGSGAYEHWISFDPATLLVDRRLRAPQRLVPDDWESIYQALVNRHRTHGAVTVLPPKSTYAEMLWTKEGFGLGYCDGPKGELTHYFWASASGEQGPYEIRNMAYQTSDQFLELMALLKSFGDQIRLVKMKEPAEIQMQDLIRNPFRPRIVSAKTKFEHINRASSYWQSRICDLEACIGATHLNTPQLQFNLRLSDPIEQLLPADTAWRGCAGDYTISFGQESSLSTGFSAGLPVLDASIGAFTRLWLGVRPASGLAITDELTAPEDLLKALDATLRLPIPHPDWDY